MSSSSCRAGRVQPAPERHVERHQEDRQHVADRGHRHRQRDVAAGAVGEDVGDVPGRAAGHQDHARAPPSRGRRAPASAANVRAGSSRNCASDPDRDRARPAQRARAKSSSFVSSAMPNRIAPMTILSVVRDASSNAIVMLSTSVEHDGHGATSQLLDLGAHRAAVGVLVDVVGHPLEPEVVVAARTGPAAARRPAARRPRPRSGRVARARRGTTRPARPARSGPASRCRTPRSCRARTGPGRRREDVEVEVRRHPVPVQQLPVDERVVQPGSRWPARSGRTSPRAPSRKCTPSPSKRSTSGRTWMSPWPRWCRTSVFTIGWDS